MKNTNKHSSNNRIVIALMILGLFTLLFSGCGQPAEQAKNTAANTNVNTPDPKPADLEGFTGETKKQELKNLSLPFAKGQNLTVDVANDGTVIFERDMILGKVADLTKSNTSSDTGSNNDSSSDVKSWMWANSTIPYVLPDDHAKKDIILEGIKEITSKTNLCLVARTTEADYVEFVSKDGNWSAVGRIGGRQEISITNAVMATVAHEIMHAAGFSHMQSREDRDTYVTINLNNVVEGKEHNFQRLTDKSSNRGDYDFNSILHYPAYGFSKNGEKTIDVKGTGDSSNMGQRKALSPGDIASIAKVYATPGTCKSTSESKTTAAAGTCGATPGDDEVYIYEHIFSQDNGGKCVKLTAGEYKDAAAMGLADNIMSSIRVGKNVHAVVCDEVSFGGTCMAFDKDDDNFVNNATLKNDTASSVKVSKAEICSPQSADKPVSLKWTNKTDKNLRIIWINYQCQERNDPREVQRNIKPGDVMEERSFVGHIFHVTNFDTNESYGYIYVNESNAVHEIKDIK